MSNLQAALAAYKNGDLIIVTDDADLENEGDLMILAEKATAEKVAFMVRHTTGILCVAMTQERARTHYTCHLWLKKIRIQKRPHLLSALITSQG